MLMITTSAVGKQLGIIINFLPMKTFIIITINNNCASKYFDNGHINYVINTSICNANYFNGAGVHDVPVAGDDRSGLRVVKVQI